MSKCHCAPSSGGVVCPLVNMKKSSRPTIFDLVKHVGISRGTISRAFNDQPGIKAATKERILRAAREIGYVPHNGARMIRLVRTNRWGILIPHLQNPYYGELVEALNSRVAKLGITLLVGISENDKAREAKMIAQWSAGETDAIILDQSHYRDNPLLFDHLKACGIALVFLHGDPIPGFDFVRYSIQESSRRLMTHFLELGHTRIAYVGQSFAGCRETARFLAYENSLTKEGLALDECLIHFGEDSAEGGRNAFRKWLALGEMPTAVFCADDIIACGVIQIARSAGLSIPDDLSVSGVDDIAESARAGITTIKTDRQEVAKAVCEIVEARKAEPDRAADVRTIPTELILRDTIARSRRRITD